MEYRKLGASGLEVSALAYGAWQLGDKTYWGDSSWEDDEASVQAAFDAGINLFDTAAGTRGVCPICRPTSMNACGLQIS